MYSFGEYILILGGGKINLHGIPLFLVVKGRFLNMILILEEPHDYFSMKLSFSLDSHLASLDGE